MVFTDGSEILGSSPLDAAGRAAVTTAQLCAGEHGITARYSGDDTFTPASTALEQTVVDD